MGLIEHTFFSGLPDLSPITYKNYTRDGAVTQAHGFQVGQFAVRTPFRDEKFSFGPRRFTGVVKVVDHYPTGLIAAVAFSDCDAIWLADEMSRSCEGDSLEHPTSPGEVMEMMGPNFRRWVQWMIGRDFRKLVPFRSFMAGDLRPICRFCRRQGACEPLQTRMACTGVDY